MKKIKFLLFLLISLSCLIFAGCGAHIDSKINLNTDGSGKRDIICTIPDSNFKGIIGGETALDNILKKTKPGILTMQKDKSSSSTTYTFTYEFKNFDDYISKSESLIGSKPQSNFDVSGETFHKEYSFQEENLNYKLMKWAVDAVSISGLSYTGRENLYETGQTTVTMNGKSQKYNDKINFTAEKTYSTEKIAVYTKMNKGNTFARTITYYFTDNTFSALNQNGSGFDNFMKELIPYGGKLKKISSGNNMKGYEISFSAESIDDLNAKTSVAVKGNKPSFKIAKLNDTSVFTTSQQISDSINFSNYTSGTAIDKGISYSFETPSGNKLPVSSANNAAQNITFTAPFHTTNYAAYMIAILVIILALVIVCVFIMLLLKKLKSMDLSYADKHTLSETTAEVTASETPTITLSDGTTIPEVHTAVAAGLVKCKICGSENKAGSNFCIYCGAPIIKLKDINVKNITRGINTKANTLLNKLRLKFSAENLRSWISTGEYKDILLGAAVTLVVAFAISAFLTYLFGSKLGYVIVNSVKGLPQDINKINSSIAMKPWDIMFLSYMPTIKEIIRGLQSGSSSAAVLLFHIPMLILLPIPVLSILIGNKISAKKLDIKNIRAYFRHSGLICLMNSIILALLSLVFTQHFSYPAGNGIKTALNISVSYSFFSVFAGSLLLGLLISSCICLNRKTGAFVSSAVKGIAKGLRNGFIIILAVYIITIICLPNLNHSAPGNTAKAIWKESGGIEYIISAPNIICNSFIISNAGTVSISPQISDSVIYNPLSIKSSTKNSAVSYNMFKDINDTPGYIYLILIFPLAVVVTGIYHTMLSEKRRLTPRDTIYFSAAYAVIVTIIAFINGISVKISSSGDIAKSLGLNKANFNMLFSFNIILIFVSSFILSFIFSFMFDWVFDKVRG